MNPPTAPDPGEFEEIAINDTLPSSPSPDPPPASEDSSSGSFSVFSLRDYQKAFKRKDSTNISKSPKPEAPSPSPLPPSEQVKFVFNDTDDWKAELNEFHSYAETKQWQEHASLYYKTECAWKTSSETSRQSLLIQLLQQLHTNQQTIRVIAARKLIYLTQGCWQECKSSSEQVQFIKANHVALIQLSSLQDYVTALRTAMMGLSALSKKNMNVGAVFQAAERACGEIELLLTLIYFQLEIQRHLDAVHLFELLDETNPSLVLLLSEMISRLMERSTKGFPVKKLLLTFWKALLGSLGGVTKAKSLRNQRRQHFNLPTYPVNGGKSNVNDFLRYHQDLSTKYPFMEDSPHLSLPYIKFISMCSRRYPETPFTAPIPLRKKVYSNPALNPNPPILQPFIFPFANDDKPKALTEAVSLFQDSVYCSLLHFDTCRCLDLRNQQLKGLLLPDETSPISLTEQDFGTFSSISKVEKIYGIFNKLKKRGMRPLLPSVVLFLAKILIATMATNTALPTRNTEGGGDNERKMLTLEEVDAARHKEIMWKAVAGVVLLLLKHFKSNHSLQFEYLGQMLVDANIIPLVLKLFSQYDAYHLAYSHFDLTSYNFLTYCTLPNKPKVSPNMYVPTPTNSSSNSNNNKWSWRNVFSIVTFLRILQMLIKRRSSRISLMMQYKATAVLKRVLKLEIDLVQLYALKLCKNIVPFTGRKWRSINMKIVTSIYLNCRQDLRDDWLMAGEPEIEADEAQMQDLKLRELVQWYNQRYYEQQQQNLALSTENSSITTSAPSRPVSTLWDDVPPSELASFDVTFVNDYELWLENEVYNAHPEDSGLVDEIIIDDLPPLSTPLTAPSLSQSSSFSGSNNTEVNNDPTLWLDLLEEEYIKTVNVPNDQLIGKTEMKRSFSGGSSVPPPPPPPPPRRPSAEGGSSDGKGEWPGLASQPELF